MSPKWLVESDGGSASEETAPGPLVVRVLHRIDGQRLTKVSHNETCLALEFDYGAKLEIFYSRECERWTLYRRNKSSVSLEADGSLVSG